MQSIVRDAVPVKEIPRRVPAHPELQPRMRRATGTVVQVQFPGEHVARLRVAIDGAPFAFGPGQYAEVSFDGSAPRAYAMANRCGDPLLEFHVPRAADDAIAGYVANEVREGAAVRLLGPCGRTLLRKPAGEPILLIAGDGGLAPIKSVLLSLLAESADDIGPVHLYHGAQEADALYDCEILANAGGGIVHYVPVVMTPSLERTCRHGSLAQAMESDFPTLAGFTIYVVGPSHVVDECSAMAMRLGALPGDVRTNAFHALPERPDEANELQRKGILAAILRS